MRDAKIHYKPKGSDSIENSNSIKKDAKNVFSIKSDPFGYNQLLGFQNLKSGAHVGGRA